MVTSKQLLANGNRDLEIIGQHEVQNL